jgi:DNA-binding NtrC family response regulator
VPPLRQRPADVMPVCRHFLKSFNRESLALGPEEAVRLESYDWPGNVRELRNIIERSLLLYRGGPFEPSALLTAARPGQPAPKENLPDPDGGIRTMEQVEHEYMMLVLKKFKDNKSQAAKALGISLSSLKRKLKE